MGDPPRATRLSIVDVDYWCIGLSLGLLYLSCIIHPLTVVFYFSVFSYVVTMYIGSLMSESVGKEERIKYLSYVLILICVAAIGLVIPGAAKSVKRTMLFIPSWATYVQTYPGYYYDFLVCLAGDHGDCVV